MPSVMHHVFWDGIQESMVPQLISYRRMPVPWNGVELIGELLQGLLMSVLDDV